MTLQELRQAEIEYCKGSVEYFIDTYGHIEDKDADELIQPFEMWEEQRNALRSIMANRLNAILKARQLGFSWLVMHIAAWLLLCFTGRTVIGLSRTEEEAKELVRRLGVILSNIPELIAEVSHQPANWTGPTFRATALELTIYFPDGPVSVFKAFPSSPNAARSFTADLIIFDEWAFQQFASEIWTAAFPVINRPFGGKVIGLSTIERGSLFEEIFTNPDNGFNKIFIPWYADPRRDDAWYENTKKALGDLITQEYPASIEEALTVPGGAFFPEVNARNTIANEELKGNVLKYVAIDYGLDMFSAHWFYVDAFGNAQVYREYDKSGLTISEAAGVLISMCEDETIELFLAPPDLWNRSQETGKSRAQLWAEAGINLTKTSNDFAAGCAGMKEWLKPRGENQKSRLTILEDCAPNLYRCLQKIQKDKKKPNVYAKDPHDLTHACLTGDTIVRTLNGDFAISDLVGTEGYVYCKNKRGRLTLKKYFPVCMTNPSADIYEVELEDGTIIKATADHKIWTNNGFKEIKDLTEQDEVPQFSFGVAIRLHTLCWNILSGVSTYCKRILHRK